jgi:hypothetical protein
MTLPRFRNSENVGTSALRSSVPRCSFLDQKPDLAFVWLGRRHELPYGIKHRQCLPAKNRYSLAVAVP